MSDHFEKYSSKKFKKQGKHHREKSRSCSPEKKECRRRSKSRSSEKKCRRRSKSRSHSDEKKCRRRSKSRSRSDQKECRRRSKSRSRSNSSSSSSSSSNSSSRSHSRSKSHSRSHSRSKSRSKSRSYSPEKKFEWCDIYQYFKNRLVCDEELMVAGSTAYINAVNNASEIIPTNHAVSYNTVTNNYNVDYIAPGSPFFVREDGVYIAFFVGSVDTAAQFTVFLNGTMQPNTCIGTNSGAGQVVARYMLELKQDDQILVRNYITTSNSLNSIVNAGGTQTGNSASFVLLKIAPLHKPKFYKKYDMISHKKKRLFKAVQEALVCDDELMVKGYNHAGTFYSTVGQIVPLEGDVNFAQQTCATGLHWNPATPSQVVVKKDGVYKVFFLLTDSTAVQFAVAVNGIPIESTTNGTNKGAGQLTSRSILNLRKGDVVTVRNHSSQNGSAQITDHAGGSNASIDLILTMFRIAPICKPCIKPVPKCVEDKLECLYKPLKQYLLCKDYLQIEGSKAYLSLTDTMVQTVPQNGSFYWSTPAIPSHNVCFRPGDSTFVVKKCGVYDIFGDIATNEPMQFCVFVNGVAEPNTNFGRDSGGNRCLMRQFISLKKGDVVSIRNFLSTSTSITTISNAGGNNIGNNAVFMAFLLHPE